MTTLRAARAPALPAARPTLLAPALSAVLGLAIVHGARWGPDWPAQEFRAWVAAHDGLTAWTSRWYGGEALPGYSVLYPILSGVVGAGLVGLMSAVVAAWAASSLAPPRPRQRWFAIAVAVSLTQSLLIGQVPFLLGAAFGLLAIRSITRDGSAVLAAALAALCSLSSPLAGACLLLAVPALSVSSRWRRASALSAALIGVAVSLVVGGADGPFPFPWRSFAAVALFCIAAVVLTRPDNSALRRFALCYLGAALLLFLVPNAIGGNAARLGKLIAMPLAARFLTVPPRGTARRAGTALAIALAVMWPSVAFVSSIARGASDPSQRTGYYTGLRQFLISQNPTAGRLEIPFTREHWEAMWIATAFPIARGWERQTDLLYNSVLYRPLTAAGYHQWLDDNAVSLIALPKAPIDYGGRAERVLLAHPPPYLRPAWHDHNWQVWRVVNARPIVGSGATLSTLTGSSVSLSFARAGSVTVRIHGGRLWRVTEGAACVATTSAGWLRVRATSPGRVTISAQLNSQLVMGAAPCSA